MARFIVSAWFEVDIDVPFKDKGTDEYDQAVEEIRQNLEGSHAMLTASYDTYLSDRIEADQLD